jgi:hypothetical protein
MSTQSTPSILFTHSSAQRGFRLLELPPDLAELLASNDPPTYVSNLLTDSDRAHVSNAKLG